MVFIEDVSIDALRYRRRVVNQTRRAPNDVASCVRCGYEWPKKYLRSWYDVERSYQGCFHTPSGQCLNMLLRPMETFDDWRTRAKPDHVTTDEYFLTNRFYTCISCTPS